MSPRVKYSIPSLFPPERYGQHVALRPTNRSAIMVGRLPDFLVARDPTYVNTWQSLKAIFTRIKLLPSRNRAVLFRHGTLARPKLSKRPFGASVVLHCSLIGLLFYLHRAFPTEASAEAFADSSPEIIYYPAPLLEPSKKLPHVAPAGSGMRPGSSSTLDGLPTLSVPSKNPLLAVSKPPHPDNSRQTIYQSSAPPKLRITSEMKLPNVVLGQPSDAPKPSFMPNQNEARPTPVSRNWKPALAPSLALAAPETPELSLFETSAFRPQLPIPQAAASVPQMRIGNGASTEPDAPSVQASDNPSSLVVMGVDPSVPVSPIALPPGNRWGKFSISPYGSGSSASTGTRASGTTGGDTAGSATGGASGDASSPGPVTISGARGNETMEGMLGASALLYRVPPHPSLRRNSLVVSTGPIGGGGLDVYGVLHCGKIYTIFLPMPGLNWTMQYCQKIDGTERPLSESRSTFVRLGTGLVPPDPELESRFDFHRLPVPPEKANKMIVLKGTLGTDGAIKDLGVLQGVLPVMDEAARIAFSRWRFKPAIRNGKAVAVEILVGVPVSVAPGGQSQ